MTRKFTLALAVSGLLLGSWGCATVKAGDSVVATVAPAPPVVPAQPIASATTSPPEVSKAAPAPSSPTGSAGFESLHSLLWIQTSVEYRGIALEAYRLARQALDAGLDDNTWTAALEQIEPYQQLPPAVIVDADETVLDNTPYLAGLVERQERFGAESWQRWCTAAEARAVPGALEFLQYAASRGVTVFYVTNRAKELTAATETNLRRLGFPLVEGQETVLTRGLHPGWESSDKGPRRAEVTHRYRVILLVGDDLGDFFSGNRVAPAERSKGVEPFLDHWGTRWVVIPNPIYGSWADSLTGFARDLTPAEEQAKKLGWLESFAP
ncbi:MAG: HAD family acid phosphatase [Thermoanaerobaculia bacterium]